ncbi:MAG TPA: methylmalonyl Co-A mutase-associated GTPase MeaB [Terracidiphilus sp.]|jgi:LAO/AO transport system kinase
MKSALRELPGCEAPDAPGAAKRSRSLTREQYRDGILGGDRAVLARAVTLIESAREKDRELAEQIVEDCLPHCCDSVRVGITGVPGAGKSSLIEALGRFLIAERKEKVAVLAIDPSSEISGGSILGDKTRMPTLAASGMAFIRPSPSRGMAGGVAQRTREAMLLCEAAGYRNLLVETIGVGQSETAVNGMVDFFLLITLAGAGDELQGIKRGVMELADLVAVNKADGANMDAAERARAEAQNALHFFPAAESGWMPRAVTCSALTGAGICELWGHVMQYAALTRANGWLAASRREQQRRWMHEMIDQSLRQRFDEHAAVRSRIKALERDVAEGRTTPFRAARALLKAASSF